MTGLITGLVLLCDRTLADDDTGIDVTFSNANSDESSRSAWGQAKRLTIDEEADIGLLLLLLLRRQLAAARAANIARGLEAVSRLKGFVSALADKAETQAGVSYDAGYDSQEVGC